MRLRPSLRATTGRLTLAAIAPALLLSQNLLVYLAYYLRGSRLELDAWFWILPIRRLAFLPGLPAALAALAFAYALAVSWALACLAYRRASQAGWGFGAAALAVVPGLQILAVALLVLLPPDATGVEQRAAEDGGHEQAKLEAASSSADVLQGLVAGMAIVVAAVLISALTFGAYGWGLFVMTPFVVGLTTAYLANRRVALTSAKSMTLVMAAGGLGTLALLMLALEGFMCIVLVAPLAALAAAAGGGIGRAAALARNAANPPLMSLALLPAIFALEAAMPPAVPLEVHDSIEIAAPPQLVWASLISGDPISSSPGLVGRAGLSFPVRSRMIGEGVGAERRGTFSTGTARERVTAWVPGRSLAFVVLSQPPVMEEMSPWRRVHAPHVSGYFDTSETRFELVPLPGGGTRLSLHAAHILRLEPVLYWEPIARWAIRQNVSRVMNDVRSKAESRCHRLGRRCGRDDPKSGLDVSTPLPDAGLRGSPAPGMG